MGRSQEDIHRVSFWRAVMSEFAGTTFLLMVGCGASTDTDQREHAWTVKVSLAFGLTYTAAIYSARTVCDAHINPAITVAMLTTRRISFARGALYLTAQLCGAVIGAAIALVFGAAPVTQIPSTGDDVIPRAPTGCTVPGSHVTESQAFAVEFLGSFFLVFVVFACYDKSSRSDCDLKVRPKVKEREYPFVIGLTYCGVLLFAMPYTGGGANTARSFGPALVNNVWTSHWIYWFAPLMGGVSAGATYDVIFSTRASLRRVRACLLAFHETEEYPRDDVTGGGFDQRLQPGAGFLYSASDDVMTADRKDDPDHLLSMNEGDVEDITDCDVIKDESRSTLDYRKAESMV